MPFSCDHITDPEIRNKLDRIQKSVASIARPLVCLPNIHPKEGLESPPQFVAATKNTIVPQLTAPAMNCGMSILRTTLTDKDFSEEFLAKFAMKLRSGVHERLSKTKTIFQWFGLYRRTPAPYDLTKDELEDFFINGAEAATRKYNLPAGELDWMEYRGCVLSENEKKEINLKKLVPRSSYANGRHEMGYNFGHNHFLEFHVVEEILNAEKAAEFHISKGQILMFYHGGGGHATYHLGRYFGRRIKNTAGEKMILFVLKFMFHFGSWEGIRSFRIRWRAYFSRSMYPEIAADTAEGKRLMQSIKIGLNYGYAFRMALVKRINDSLPKGSVSLLWDAAHNSIMEEKIGNEKLIIHRQDAMRVFSGKPVMIAGFNSLAYIGAGSSDASTSFWSATPSAGKTIAAFLKQGKSSTDDTRIVVLSKRKEKDLIKKPSTTPEGLFEVVHNLEQEGVVQPVAYIRTLATIKGH